MSKRRKSNDSSSQQPLQQPTSSEDLSGDASRIDIAAGEVSESQSPVDQALQPTEEQGQDAPKRGRGRPPGSGNSSKKGKKAETDAKKEEADRFLKDALGSVVTQSVAIAKTKGWSSPETKIASEQQWCMSVATCLDAIVNKYLPDALMNYQEEAALLLLVLPWVTSNLMRGVKRGKDSRSVGGNGIGQNHEAVRTDTGVSAPDPDRPHVG